uniref:Putative multidrug resistance-associated protein lethal(2)03659 n=1 Tax=Lygus hesperus TaxID=30085 RepID=A0A146KSC1_LYGHE
MYGYVFKYQKKPHPRAKASFLSVLTFSWMIPLFFKGISRPLDSRDLYEPLSDNKSDKLGDLMEKAWDVEVLTAQKRGKRPNYLRALRSVFGRQLVLQGGLIFILEFAVRLSQPFFLGGLISNITSHDQRQLNVAYACAGGIIGATLLTAIIMHSYHMGIVLTGMNMRIATCSLIYRKVLSMKGTSKVVKGQIVNLMANDALRFDYAATCLHDLWIAPLQVVLVTYFLYRIVGLAAFVGMATMFACAPLQVWMGKMTSFLREQTALRSDARISFMSEVINGIHVIKTHAWEQHIIKLVKKMRIAEMRVIQKMAVVRGIMSSFQMYHTRSAAALTILAYVLMNDRTLTAYKVFMLTSFFGVLGTTVGVFFPTGISLVSECYTSVKRVEEFLIDRLDKPSHSPVDEKFTRRSSDELSGVKTSDCLELQDVSASWSADLLESTLRDVTMRASAGRLTIVLGSVGSGKTSLLQTILGELIVCKGNVLVPQNVSYASQEPWLFAGSVRKNILFGEEFDEERYQNVIRECALEEDVATLKYNDFTKVGDRGVALSGGQKARVNLARAVYKDADVYLLDDPLSSVDSIVRLHLLENCIRPLSREKAVILVTHCLEHLREDDHVIYLENGRVKHDGTICDVEDLDLLESQIEPPPEEPKMHDDPPDFPALLNDIPNASMSSLVSEKSPYEIAEEDMKKRQKKSSLSAFTSAGGCTSSFVILFFIAAQTFGSASDYWVSIWVDLEEHSYNATGSSNEIIKRLPWSINRKFCLWVFAVLILGTMSVSIIRSLMHFFTCIRASTVLHRRMLKSVMSAKMQFFYTSKSGSILSRFSKDQGTVDEHLPVTLMDCLQVALTAFGILLVIPATNAWLFVPTLVILAVFYLFRLLYVRTTKGLREIEGQARSPLFSHIGSTVDGLPIIHSRKAEKMVTSQFDSLQDFHTSAWYLYLAANRTFAFWLDVFCMVYNAAVTLSFVIFRQGVLVADVGLAITQCSGLAYTMEWGLRQSAEVENSLVSVTRIAEYSNLERDSPRLTLKSLKAYKKVDDKWPSKGSVKFLDVYMRYSKHSPWVLKGLTFSVKPGQKVGIVGRTGSGKSSIALTLFRLVAFEGVIKIDGVDIRHLRLDDLRPRLTVIPQDPVLFSGTLRSNLDPLVEYEDSRIWEVLKKVEMADFVGTQAGGLAMAVDENGGNLSTGQKQLLCLARGILRSNKIVVLDEATANVDKKTENIIQRAMKISFADTTVITIAHRIHTVMECDVIIVMENGRIKQIGQPHELIREGHGPFYSLVKESNDFRR